LFSLDLMRAQLAALLVSTVALATITVMPPAKQKSTLLGEWEALDLDLENKGDSYFYRMVLLPGDDGYLVWPRVDDRAPLQAATFLGRLAKLEFKEGHVKLLFKLLPNQLHLAGVYDSIEIDGDVVAIEDTEEESGFAEIRGTTTVRNERDLPFSLTRPLRMAKPGFAQQLAHRLEANAQRAKDLIAQEMKPGPQGSRDEALAILREAEVIHDDTGVVSAEWSDNSREWHVVLAGERTVKVRVNVPAHDFYFMDDSSK
jgi:hypothetical protein